MVQKQTFQEENFFGAFVAAEAHPLFSPSTASSAFLLSRSVKKCLTEYLTSTIIQLVWLVEE